MPDEIVYSRLTALPAGIETLDAEAERAGFRMIGRLRTEWADGSNRFDGVGEAFFAAHCDGVLIGVGGLNRDPYASEPRMGRVRHLYVLETSRRLGVGRGLVERVTRHAAPNFSTLRLWTDRASDFYERLGFEPADGAQATHVLRMSAIGGTELADEPD